MNIQIIKENEKEKENYIITNLGINVKNTKWFKRFSCQSDEFFHGGRE